MSTPFALIIEDHRATALIFTTALQTAGYRTETIASGELAEQRLLEVVPDMIILDMHLPSISGQKLLAQIRQDERLKLTRVIVATADAALASGLRDKPDLVLVKPVSFDQLTLLSKRLKPKDESNLNGL